jgi:hypothetical protein
VREYVAKSYGGKNALSSVNHLRFSDVDAFGLFSTFEDIVAI